MNLISGHQACVGPGSRAIKSAMLTAKRLRKILRYDPKTGSFRWKVTISSRATSSSVAGALGRRGHRQIRIDGKLYQASRPAWLYKTGTWPKAGIQFVNGNNSDTRWTNLRESL